MRLYTEFDKTGRNTDKAMMEGYPITARIVVRWRDVDALGHVNNAVYFTYFEIARGLYLDRVFRQGGFSSITCILAYIRCDFLKPVRFGEVAKIGIRIPAVGRTSFVFEYKALSLESNRTIARAQSMQVLYDRRSKEKIAIKGQWLAEIAGLQGEKPLQIEKGTI